jgi:hypothetical protein
MPIVLQPPFSCHRMFKSLACKKGMLSPLPECYSDGTEFLLGFLSLIKTCCLWRSQILSHYVSFLLLHFPFIWCWNPGESFELGKHLSWVTTIPWQSSYCQWCTPMGSPVQAWYARTRSKRCLSFCKGHGQCPTLSPKLPNLSLNLSLSLSFPTSLSSTLYDSNTTIFFAEPPYHTDNCLGYRIRGNCSFELDSSPKNS